MIKMNPKVKYALLSALGFLMSIVLYVTPMKTMVENHTLVKENEAYLQGIEHIDRENLMLLTEIDGVITVLNSSEIGVSFFVDAQVKIGHALSAFTRFISDGLELTLLSLTVTKSTQWLLEICESISPILLCLCFLSVGIYNLFKFGNIEKTSGQPYTKRVLEFSFVLFLCSYLVIPYTVYSTALVDNFVYTQLTQEKNTNLKNLHSSVVNQTASHSLEEKAQNDIKHFEKMMVHLPQKVDMMANYHSDHFVYNLFRAIVMPGFMFFMIYIVLCRHVLAAFMERVFKG